MPKKSIRVPRKSKKSPRKSKKSPRKSKKSWRMSACWGQHGIHCKRCRDLMVETGVNQEKIKKLNEDAVKQLEHMFNSDSELSPPRPLHRPVKKKSKGKKDYLSDIFGSLSLKGKGTQTKDKGKNLSDLLRSLNLEDVKIVKK